MFDALLNAFVDFVVHVLCYRLGEIVLRVTSLGRLNKQFFNKYTYFTIFVGALSIAIVAIVVGFSFTKINFP